MDAVLALGLLERHVAGSRGAGFGAYLAELCALWRPVVAGQGVKIVAEVQDLDLAPDQAMALALIVHELAANSFKHAFPDGHGGEVRVTLMRVGNDEAELAVVDDGIGYASERVSAGGSLGIKLLGGLAAQAGGRLSLSGGKQGTEARVRFALR